MGSERKRITLNLGQGGGGDLVEANSPVANSIAQLQHLRVEVKQPFCWLIKTSSIPWSSKQCEEERGIFFAKLLKTYYFALWCSDAVKEGAGIGDLAEVTWVTSSDPIPRILRENSHLGDWVLLLFCKEVRSAVGVLRHIDLNLRSCDDATKMLEATGADLVLYSMPDDIDWLIAQRH